MICRACRLKAYDEWVAGVRRLPERLVLEMEPTELDVLIRAVMVEGLTTVIRETVQERVDYLRGKVR